MIKATQRLTAAQRQAAQARLDRKAEVADRRAARQAGIPTISDEYRVLYANIGA